jgi:hypothetical protein
MTDTHVLVLAACFLAGMAVAPFLVAGWRRWRRGKGQHRG